MNNVLLKGCARQASHVCLTLQSLTQDAATNESIAEAGGIKTMLGMLRQRSSPDLLTTILATLWTMSSVPSTSHKIAVFGGVKTIVLMAQDGTEAQQINAVATLWSLSAHAEIVHKIAKSGGIQVLIDLMSHGRNERCMTNATATLWNIARLAGPSKMIGHLGAIPPLIKLAIDGTSDQKTYATGALGNLALNEDNNLAIVESQGLNAIFAMAAQGTAMQKKRAAGALRCLASSPRTSFVIAHTPYGVTLLLRLLEEGDDDDDLQTEAMGALSFLSCIQENMSKLEESSAFEIVGQLETTTKIDVVRRLAQRVRTNKEKVLEQSIGFSSTPEPEPEEEPEPESAVPVPESVVPVPESAVPEPESAVPVPAQSSASPKDKAAARRQLKAAEKLARQNDAKESLIAASNDIDQLCRVIEDVTSVADPLDLKNARHRRDVLRKQEKKTLRMERVRTAIDMLEEAHDVETLEAALLSAASIETKNDDFAGSLASAVERLQKLKCDVVTSAQEALIDAPDTKVAMEGQCVVCLDGPQSHAFVPCGHICCCEECSELIMQDTKLCPLCHTPSIWGGKMFKG